MSLVVNYKGTQIAELTQDGSLTLNTAGKYCEGNISLDYSGGGAPTPPETPTDAVIFYSPNAFTLQVGDRTKHWDGTLYSSTDYSTWNVWDGTTVLNAGERNGYYTLYLRGIGSTKITGLNNNSYAFYLGGTQIKCCGNLNNLLDYTSSPTLASYALACLFCECGNVDFNVSLPAETLALSCYQYMFYNCSSLTTAPALPATTLANNCYQYMFGRCKSLTTAPALPATTLASNCYQYMFSNCKSLTTAPALPATTLASNCYQYMFQGSTQIKLSTTRTGAYQTEYRIPTSGTGTAPSGELSGMFSNTGGTFTGTPTINTTYYTSNTVIPAS